MTETKHKIHIAFVYIYTKERIYLSVKTKLHHLQSNQKWANSHLKRAFFFASLLFNHLHKPSRCDDGGGGGGGGNNAIEFDD